MSIVIVYCYLSFSRGFVDDLAVILLATCGTHDWPNSSLLGFIERNLQSTGTIFIPPLYIGKLTVVQMRDKNH